MTEIKEAVASHSTKKTKRDKHILKKCFSCSEEILVKYNMGTGEYIKKNDWYY
jgi:hypothetical protein